MRYASSACCVLALCAPGSCARGHGRLDVLLPVVRHDDSHDGDYAHWAQGGHSPPDDIASNYYPALGVYSSSSAAVLDAQMADVARAGINELAVSWWGKGSAEDQRLPAVIAAAGQRGIAVAVHLEPYRGRTRGEHGRRHRPTSRALGVRTFYLYRAVRPPGRRTGRRRTTSSARRASRCSRRRRSSALRQRDISRASTPTTRSSTAAACSRGSASRRTRAGCSARRRSGPATTRSARPATRG